MRWSASSCATPATASASTRTPAATALTVGYSTALRDFGAEYAYEALRTDNRGRFGIEAKISKLELIRYHGFGNETAITDDDDFYEVKQRQYSFAPSYRLDLDPIDIHVGPVLKFAPTDLDDGTTLLGLERPYGTEDFGQVGARVRIALDRRDIEKAPTKGGIVLAEAPSTRRPGACARPSARCTARRPRT